jgi:hypothetical protein
MNSPLRKILILLCALVVPVGLDAERRLPKRKTKPRHPRPQFFGVPEL